MQCLSDKQPLFAQSLSDKFPSSYCDVLMGYIEIQIIPYGNLDMVILQPEGEHPCR